MLYGVRADASQKDSDEASAAACTDDDYVRIDPSRHLLQDISGIAVPQSSAHFAATPPNHIGHHLEFSRSVGTQLFFSGLSGR